MTMLPYKEFTDEEIIKAVECCSEPCCVCDECPLYCVGVNCSSFELHRYALDLINRQKTENENLKVENQSLRSAANSLKMHYEESQAEIERLKECPKCVYEYDGEITEYCVQSPCPNFKTVEQIKSEAVKEFSERLKEKSFQSFGNYGITRDVVEVCDIDNLIKEMVGVNTMNDNKEVKVLTHKVIRVDNLMYDGCEPHWKCTRCGKCVPFHCYTKEQFENQECNITDKQNKSEVDKLIELFQDTEHKHWLRDDADMKEFAEYLVSRGVYVKRRRE